MNKRVDEEVEHLETSIKKGKLNYWDDSKNLVIKILRNFLQNCRNGWDEFSNPNVLIGYGCGSVRVQITVVLLEIIFVDSKFDILPPFPKNPPKVLGEVKDLDTNGIWDENDPQLFRFIHNVTSRVVSNKIEKLTKDVQIPCGDSNVLIVVGEDMMKQSELDVAELLTNSFDEKKDLFGVYDGSPTRKIFMGFASKAKNLSKLELSAKPKNCDFYPVRNKNGTYGFVCVSYRKRVISAEPQDTSALKKKLERVPDLCKVLVYNVHASLVMEVFQFLLSPFHWYECGFLVPQLHVYFGGHGKREPTSLYITESHDLECFFEHVWILNESILSINDVLQKIVVDSFKSEEIKLHAKNPNEEDRFPREMLCLHMEGSGDKGDISRLIQVISYDGFSCDVVPRRIKFGDKDTTLFASYNYLSVEPSKYMGNLRSKILRSGCYRTPGIKLKVWSIIEKHRAELTEKFRGLANTENLWPKMDEDGEDFTVVPYRIQEFEEYLDGWVSTETYHDWENENMKKKKQNFLETDNTLEYYLSLAKKSLGNEHDEEKDPVLRHVCRSVDDCWKKKPELMEKEKVVYEKWKKTILTAVEEFTEKVGECIQFVDHSDSKSVDERKKKYNNSGVLFRTYPPDAEDVQDGTRRGSATVGMLTGVAMDSMLNKKGQAICLLPDPLNKVNKVAEEMEKNDVIHEMLHVIGVEHEHQREDFQSEEVKKKLDGAEYLNVPLLVKKQNEKVHNYQILRGKNYVMINDFDTNSIMLYRKSGFTSSGMTDGDVKTVKFLYGSCPREFLKNGQEFYQKWYRSTDEATETQYFCKHCADKCKGLIGVTKESDASSKVCSCNCVV